MTLPGKNFKSWYEGLSREERLEYSFIVEDLKTSRPSNVGKQNNK